MKSQLLIPAIYNFLENIDTPGFEKFYEYAAKRDVPVVSKAVGSLLSFMTSVFKPKKVLELGCGIGTAAKYILDNTDAHYTGVDNNLERLQVAEKFLEGYERVRFVHSRVEQFFENDNGQYDFVFVDSIKKDYEKVWYLMKGSLAENSLIIFDDFFLYGYIFQEEAEIPLKYREGVRLLRRFINNIKVEKNVKILFLPIENGVMVIHYEH